MSRVSREPSPPPSRGPGPVVRPNSLGLSCKQLDAIMQRPEGPVGSKASRERRFVRRPFRHPSVEFRVLQGGSANACQVACRNLSCGGMSVVHSAYIYPGSPCVVGLRHPATGAVLVTGVVVRCIHVQGRVHEIGIRFDNPISAGLVGCDPIAGQFSLETVEPGSLVGALLYAHDSRPDQERIKHSLRGTGVRLLIAETAARAGEIARDGCDIVLCDEQVGGGKAAEVFGAVRQARPSAPVIIVTTDLSPGTTERVRRMPANASLPKPFTDDQLRQALGEFLIVRPQRSA